MVLVKNPNVIYKPEYSITQLLTEWIITNNNSENKKEKIYGIRYTSSLSASSASGFEYPKDKLDNIVFFVLDPLSTKKYCPQLSKAFKITNPTCNEYEKLKCGYGIDLGVIDKLSEEERLKFNYEVSDFGNLERDCKTLKSFLFMRSMDSLNIKPYNESICVDRGLRVSSQKWLLIEMSNFAANQIYRIMYSSEDLERFYFQYQTEALPHGESLQSFCVKNKVPYNIFQKWFKDTRKKVVEVQVDGAPEISHEDN